MDIDFDILELGTPAGTRSALVITPTQQHLVGPLPYIPTNESMSEADQ